MNGPTSGWLEKLAADLEHSELQYVGLRALAQGLLRPSDVENVELQEADFEANATLQAARHLMIVVEALRQLEPFSVNAGLAPLHDIVTAIMELDKGQRPQLLQPRASVGVGGDSVGRNYIKAHAVLGVQMLRDIGVGQMDACKEVARIFGKAGVRGRKRTESLSHKTVDEWTGNLSNEGQAFLHSMLEKIRKHPDAPRSQKDVIEKIQNIAASPLIQTKIR